MRPPDEATPTAHRERLQALAVLHRPRVRRVALRFLRDPDAADDVTQDVFVRLQRSPPKLDDTRIGSWLHTVTLNLCRDQLRRRARAAERLATDDAPATAAAAGADPAARLDRDRARRALDQAIERLPADQARAIRLRFVEGLSYGDIARRLGVPQGTVASRVFRALARLGQDVEALHLEVLS